MTARLREMADDELGQALSSLDVSWPATPDLATPVMRQVASPRPARVVRMPRSRRGRVLLIAAATALMLGGVAVAAKLVIDLGAVVVHVPEDQGTPPSAPPASFGAPIGLDRAEDLLGEEVDVPDALGTPDRVWADEVITDAGTVVRVTLAWAPRPDLPPIRGTQHGAILMRFEGDEDQAVKGVQEDAGTVEPARVGDAEAVWTTGPHVLELLTSDGIRYVRVNGNVLIWRDGPSTLRLETSLPKGEAIRIAESVAGTS